jgi:hypothetical protein
MREDLLVTDDVAEDAIQDELAVLRERVAERGGPDDDGDVEEL